MRFARRPNIARSSSDRQNHQRRVTFDCAEECAIVSYNLPGCRKVRVAGLCSNPQVPEYLSERNPATRTVSTYSKPPGSARRIFLSGEECCGGGAGCRPYHQLRSWVSQFQLPRRRPTSQNIRHPRRPLLTVSRISVRPNHRPPTTV
ncbi:hypothetical protein IG631_08818 [Alternaria alternata]|nr:hypothetical protein IG631_08818 [Alternaria alternata]